jgi:hypothetical protein
LCDSITKPKQKFDFSHHEEKVMRAIVTFTVVALIVVGLLISGCASLQTTGHKYIMRGQILEVSDGTAYVCVGTKDGAQIGQEFIVYRFERAPSVSPKSNIPSFKRAETGKLKITELVDEHMASAKILSGSVKVNDVAETNR